MHSISAIVCVRNGATYIRAALDSIAAQTVGVDEIVVLDGGSMDATRAIAAAFPKTRVIPQTAPGLAAARNQALSAARGDVVAFLDHDDRWTPRKNEIQLALLATLPRPSMVIGALRLFRTEPDGSETFDSPRKARTPGVLLADRAIFDRVGGFDTALTSGCDMDWFARAAAVGVPTALSEGVLLLKRLHGANLSRDVARNRAEAFAVIAKLRGRGGKAS